MKTMEITVLVAVEDFLSRKEAEDAIWGAVLSRPVRQAGVRAQGIASPYGGRILQRRKDGRIGRRFDRRGRPE